MTVLLVISRIKSRYCATVKNLGKGAFFAINLTSPSLSIAPMSGTLRPQAALIMARASLSRSERTHARPFSSVNDTLFITPFFRMLSKRIKVKFLSEKSLFPTFYNINMKDVLRKWKSLSKNSKKRLYTLF